MKKINKKEKGAALINVMLVVLLAAAIGLPLLYLVIVNFTFRMFDNNIRSISYKNEIGMDNVYAIIQEVVIGEINEAKDRAKNEVDATLEKELDVYKKWVLDGRKIRTSAGADGKTGTDDDVYSSSDDIDKLKEYMDTAGLSYDATDSNIFTYLDIADGIVDSEAVKESYNTVFQNYYKQKMDGTETGIEGADVIPLNTEIMNKAKASPYNMKTSLSGATEHYAISTSNYTKFATANSTTKITATVKFRGISETTGKTVDSNVSATFTIGVPAFDSASSVEQTTVKKSNPLLDRTMVAGKAIEVYNSKKLNITGDVIVSGENLTASEYPLYAKYRSNINITGDLMVDGDIALAGGGGSSDSYRTKLIATGDVFCNEIRTLGSYTNTNIVGALYINDDMELGKTYTTMTLGTLICFNDIDVPDDIYHSSAILYNNENSITGLSFNVTDAYIFGTAIVENTDFKTGESIGVKGNYRAYQIPLLTGAYDTTKVEFKSLGGFSFVNNFKSNGKQLTNEERAEYFNQVRTENKMSFVNPTGLNISNMQYSAGMWYKSGWKTPVKNVDEDFRSNALKEYEKQTKFFGYGEGNQYRYTTDEIDPDSETGERFLPTIVGEYGWIDSDYLAAAAEKYSSFNSDDDVIVLVSEGDITLGSSVNGKKGIIIAGGDITVGANITFEGSIICGGKLKVNNNFTLINNEIALQKIIEDGVSNGDKELFNLFRDDESGNLYNYSTIDTQIANVDMNSLIKISNWNKKKFNI